MHEASITPAHTPSEQETPTLEEMLVSLTSLMSPCRDRLVEFDEAWEKHIEAAKALGEALVEAEVIEADRLSVELAGGGVAWVSPENYEEVCRYRGYRTLNDPKAFAMKEYVFRKEYRNGREIKVYLHRQIMGPSPGDGKEVDHIDGDTSNNVRSNIRVATTAQNCRNRKKQDSYGSYPTSSPYKGVVRIKHRDLWTARIRKDGKQHFLGNFTDPLHSDFARLNSEAHPELLRTEGRA